jgi:uracil-DNA glycosylase
MKNTFVRPAGILASAKLLIVGEHPERQDVFDNQTFSSYSEGGRELDVCLSNTQLNRNECYLTNVIKDVDKPIEVYFEEVKRGQTVIGLNPNEDAQTYMQELKTELEKSSCNVILAVGNIALYALTGRYGITKWRGSILESTLVPGKLVVGCVNPKTVDRGQFMNRRLITFDIQRCNTLVREGFHPLANNIRIEPSYEEVLTFLTTIERDSTKLIDYDLEVYNEEVSCISIATSQTEVMSIPFVCNGGDYFNPEQELEIWLLLARILEGRNREVRGQNLTFDSAFLFRRFGIKIPMFPTKIHDTMIAQRITMIDYPKGLDFITSIHTEIPYYKEDGKKWFKVGGAWQQLWQYNAMDSLSCAQADPGLQAYLRKQQNEETYNRTRAVVGPLVYMMEHGIRVDMDGIKKKSAELLVEIEETKERLNQLVGTELNANSPKQVGEYFYNKLGYERPKKDPTDEKAMKRLKIKGREEAGLILQVRQLVKLRSTYLAEEKFDLEPDGSYRIRCSYDPVGTRFSRLSSSENIFGSGTNL